MAKKKTSKKEIKKTKENIVDVPMDTKFKEDFIDFGMYTITDRALPEVTDGLKPVQRRSIFTFAEDSMTSKHGYKKSARVVGNIMGKYHPHGDCLRGNTKVPLLNGTVKTIKELFDLQESVWVLGTDKDNKTIPVKAHSFRIGQFTNKIYKIEFCDGNILELTNNHQIRDIKGNWIKAEDLTVNSVLRMIDLINVNGYNFLSETNKGKYIHKLVNEYFNGASNGNVTHHKDEIKINNNPENLIYMSREDHAKIHSKKDIYLKSLSDCRDNMFKDDSDIREAIRIKNSTLAGLMPLQILALENYIYVNKKIPKYDEYKNSNGFKSLLSKFDSQLDFEKELFKSLAIVKSISIEEVNNEPMYDFTVTDHENMFVLVGDINNKQRLINVHNSSIYESIVNLSTSWKNSIPLIDGSGNFGNIQGLSAAAMRYTECRLTKFGDLFIKDLKPGIVEYKDNYSNDAIEPVSLPIQIPYLLISGTTGIAVGMSTSIPPHNPKEALEATIAYIKNNKISVDELMEIMPGPDFPTGGYILNSSDVKEFYETGAKNVTARGKVVHEGRKVVITEVPFSLSGRTSQLHNDINDLIFKKKLLLATKSEDFTNKKGIRIEVTAKSGESLDDLEAELFAKTKLQDTYRCMFLVIANRSPKIVTLKEYFGYYVDYQHTILKNKYKLEIDKSKDKLEVIEGLITAMTSIDVIIEIVRNAPTEAAMKRALISGDTKSIKFKTKKSESIAKKYSFTENQAVAILATKLSRLSKLDNKDLIKTKKDLENKINNAKSMIDSKLKRKNEIIKIHEEYLELFKGPEFKRKTVLLKEAPTKFIKVEKVKPLDISIDKFGYIKTLGDSKIKIENEIFRTKTNSDDQIGVFTNSGNFYKIKVSDLSESNAKDKGDSLAGLFKADGSEHLLLGNFGTPILFNKTSGNHLQVTNDGYVKLVDKKQFISTRKKIVGIKLKDDSELVYSSDFENKQYVVFVSENGLVKKLTKDCFKNYGKNASGSQLCSVKPVDRIINVYQVNNKDIITINNKDFIVSDIKTAKPTHTMKAV